MAQYSRLERIKSRKDNNKSIIYVAIGIILLLLFVFAGIPLLVKITGFIGNLKESNTGIEKNDITPPAPPEFDTTPEITNQEILDIKGFAEAGATVKLYFNEEDTSVIASKDGAFRFSVTLKKGANTFYGEATDEAGNIGKQTKEYVIVYDDEAPPLTITSPNDGASYYGNSQRQIKIEGKTENETSLKINDRIIILNADGIFSYPVSLNEGENNFALKVTDSAGNFTEKGLTVYYWK